MSLLDRPLFRTLAGKNKTGAVLFAILDVLPIPSIHEVIKAVLSKDAPKNAKDFWVAFKERISFLRLIVGSVFSGILIYLVLAGAMTAQEVAEIIKVIAEAVFGNM